MAKQGKKTQTDAKNNGATLGFEEKLWLAEQVTVPPHGAPPEGTPK